VSAADLVASALLLVITLLALLVLRARLRRRQSYMRRGRLGRLAVIVAALAGVFVVVTWLPVLVMRFVPPPTTSFMVQRMPACRGVAYQWVPWRQISAHAPIAFVAAEDQRFPHHRGFDVEAIRKVMAEAGDGGPTRGASTISQQVAKNLFLWPGRSWARKGLEAWWTVLIELTWPKQRILEVYANIAQLGPCVFGVEAAARHYFGKQAAALTPAEAALFAAVLPAPQRYRVDAPSPYVRRRQAWIQRQVRNLGGAAYLESGNRRRGD
jgi:monofunctional glycosyltransferase